MEKQTNRGSYFAHQTLAGQPQRCPAFSFPHRENMAHRSRRARLRSIEEAFEALTLDPLFVWVAMIPESDVLKALHEDRMASLEDLAAVNRGELPFILFRAIAVPDEAWDDQAERVRMVGELRALVDRFDIGCYAPGSLDRLTDCPIAGPLGRMPGTPRQFAEVNLELTLLAQRLGCTT